MNEVMNDVLRERYDSMEHDCFDFSDFLEHHGIKGQRWGNRRYQNQDGSLTPAGRIHYGVGAAREGIEKAAGAVKYTASKAGEAVKTRVSKTGKAIQKAVKPTDEQLDEKIKKSVQKAQRKEKINVINELNGKSKKLKDMTDQEVQARYQRLQQEAAIRRMEKDAKETPVGRIFNNYAKRGLQEATNRIVTNAVTELFKKEEKVKYSDMLREEKSRLELEALGGNKKAYDSLNNMGYIKNRGKNNTDSSDKKKPSNNSASDSSNNKSKSKEKNKQTQSAKVYGVWEIGTKAGNAERKAAKQKAKADGYR